MNMELRFQEVSLDIQEGELTVSGYVNKTEQLSEILGVTKRFKEKILRGAFDRAIKNSLRGIDFLVSHDDTKILSSTRNNSLELTEDETGLFMSAIITPTSFGKDAYELIKAGIFRNMSFGFRTIKDSWKTLEAGLYERTIEELELFEVSVVRDPAYSQSSIAARGINLVEEIEIPAELEEETRQMDELRELVKALSERVDTLETELTESRSVPVVEEKREEDPMPEAVVELVIESEEVVEETPTEPDENKAAEEVVIEPVVEETPEVTPEVLETEKEASEEDRSENKEDLERTHSELEELKTKLNSLR